MKNEEDVGHESFTYRGQSFEGREALFLGGRRFLESFVLLDQILDLVDRVLLKERVSVS